MSCKLISLDVSICSTGYAVYEDSKLVRYGNIVHKETKLDHAKLMIEDIYSLLETEQPQIIVVEDVPYVHNVKIFKKLERLLARIEAWAYFKEVTFCEYKPSQWRKLVAEENEKVPTKTKEAKAWSMAKTSVNQDDIADAILIGQAYINEWSNPSEIKLKKLRKDSNNDNRTRKVV